MPVLRGNSKPCHRGIFSSDPFPPPSSPSEGGTCNLTTQEPRKHHRPSDNLRNVTQLISDFRAKYRNGSPATLPQNRGQVRVFISLFGSGNLIKFLKLIVCAPVIFFPYPYLRRKNSPPPGLCLFFCPFDSLSGPSV